MLMVFDVSPGAKVTTPSRGSEELISRASRLRLALPSNSVR